LETITTSSPDQASEVPVFLKSKRCASSFLAWLTALSTSWRSTLATTSNEESATAILLPGDHRAR
jgi:adenylylsulfate kinase-like enzyme